MLPNNISTICKKSIMKDITRIIRRIIIDTYYELEITALTNASLIVNALSPFQRNSWIFETKLKL